MAALHHLLPVPGRLYLDLLKGALSRHIYAESLVPLTVMSGSRRYKPIARVLAAVQKGLGVKGFVLARTINSREAFAESPPKPIVTAETLIGPAGLDNIERCIKDVLRNDVPGDFIETGVWRGGAAIFMRGALVAYEDDHRVVWVADSFAGLPTPEISRYSEDADEGYWANCQWMAVPIGIVQENFARYGLLDERVRFLVGWFHETLPHAPIEALSIIRLDGDMYGSTMDALRCLYPKLSVGGYVIVDDYWLPKCKAAVDRYRADNAITDEIIHVDSAIVYWQRGQ